MRPPVVKHQLVAHRLQPFQQTDAGLGGQQCISNPEDLLCIDQYHRDLKVTTIRHFCIQQMSLICALLPSLEKMVPRGLIKKLWCPIFHMTCRSSKSLYSSKDFVRHPVFFFCKPFQIPRGHQITTQCQFCALAQSYLLPYFTSINPISSIGYWSLFSLCACSKYRHGHKRLGCIVKNDETYCSGNK